MIILLFQALLGTTWWGMSWFIYVKTNVADTDIYPINWFWTNLFNTRSGWMAVSYLSTFCVGLVVSFGELVAWMIFAVGYPNFAATYFSTIGLIGSTVFYIMPPLAAGLHAWLPEANGGLNSNETATFYLNDMFLFGMGTVLWFIHAVSHVIFVPRFVAYATQLRPECHCNPPPEPLPKFPTAKMIAKYEEESINQCDEKCPDLTKCRFK